MAIGKGLMKQRGGLSACYKREGHSSGSDSESYPRFDHGAERVKRIKNLGIVIEMTTPLCSAPT